MTWVKETGCRRMKKLILAVLSILLLVSCGKPSATQNNVVVTVGDISITKGEFEFYLQDVKNQLKDTEFRTDEDWQNKEIEGKKAIDLAKEQTMDIAVNNALYIEAGETAGLTLTAEDKTIVQNVKKQFIASYGSEAAYKEFLKENNITDGFIEMMCKSLVYNVKIADIVREEEAVTEEDVKAYFEENQGDFSLETRKAKHILIATIDPQTNLPKSPEEQTAASVLAKEIFDRVQKGEDFDKLMFEYSEDPGLETNPDGYIFGSGQMVPEFEQATDSVGAGEIAFCKSDFGYHIIKRLPLEYEDVKYQVESKMLTELVNENTILR